MSDSPASPDATVLGIDTHRDAHVCAALDAVGRLVAVRSIATTPEGYHELLAWARGLGAVTRAGIDGTDSYGAHWPAR